MGCGHEPKVSIHGSELSVCASCREENLARYRVGHRDEEFPTKHPRARRLCAGYRSTCPWGGCMTCLVGEDA